MNIRIKCLCGAEMEAFWLDTPSTIAAHEFLNAFNATHEECVKLWRTPCRIDGTGNVSFPLVTQANMPSQFKEASESEAKFARPWWWGGWKPKEKGNKQQQGFNGGKVSFPLVKPSKKFDSYPPATASTLKVCAVGDASTGKIETLLPDQ